MDVAVNKNAYVQSDEEDEEDDALPYEAFNFEEIVKKRLLELAEEETPKKKTR